MRSSGSEQTRRLLSSGAAEPKDRELMRQIDEIHLAYPFYGSRKIRNELWARGYEVGRDRVRRLMRLMGIEALYVKPYGLLRHPIAETGCGMNTNPELLPT